MDFEMHYHVWTRIDLDTMERDPWRYQTRSAASKYIRRHLAGQEAMVLQCDRELGLSARQLEMIYQRGLDVAGELVFRRSSLVAVPQADLETAAANLTDHVAERAAEEEYGDEEVALMFEEQSTEIERILFWQLQDALVFAARLRRF